MDAIRGSTERMGCFDLELVMEGRQLMQELLGNSIYLKTFHTRGNATLIEEERTFLPQIILY